MLQYDNYIIIVLWCTIIFYFFIVRHHIFHSLLQSIVPRLADSFLKRMFKFFRPREGSLFPLWICLFDLIFGIEPCYLAHTSFKFPVFLPLPPECKDYSYKPLYLSQSYFFKNAKEAKNGQGKKLPKSMHFQSCIVLRWTHIHMCA